MTDTVRIKTRRARGAALWHLIDRGSLWILCRGKTERQAANVAAAHFGDYADVPRELVQGQEANA